MAELWTDLIDPATLTGYTRSSLEAYESSQASLARFLPNREVNDVVARFDATSSGLVAVAEFRAYDAEPERGTGEQGKRVTIELPAIGETQPIGELEQLRSRNAAPELQLRAVQTQARRVAASIANAMEYQRGIAIQEGRQTINGRRFKSDDDFGRNPAHNVVAPAAWTDPAVGRTEQLEAWCDIYENTNNGERPGAIVMDRAAWRAYKGGDEFQTQLINGGARRPSDGDVRTQTEDAGLPPVEVYSRRVLLRNGQTVPVLQNGTVLLLPAPVDVNDWEGTQLGSSLWGRTLSSDDPDWGIEPGSAPGIVTGVYKHRKPPMIVEVVADAIGLPVLANADLSFRVRVLG